MQQRPRNLASGSSSILSSLDIQSTMSSFSALVLSLFLFSWCGQDVAASLRGLNSTQIFVPRDGTFRSTVFRIITQNTYIMEGNSSIIAEEIASVPIVDGKEQDDLFSIHLPEEVISEHINLVSSGNLFLSITDTIMSPGGIVLGSSSKIRVVQDPRVRLRKHTPPALGKKSIAVVRISTRDSEPRDDADALREGLFGTGVNLKTQFEACSFGKLQFYLSDAGIVDVLVDEKISKFKSGSALVQAAQHVMRRSMGIRDVSKIADKVLMCLPPGTGNWVASSGVNHWRAQFNDGWCMSLTATIHELGHTLGLNHANKKGKTYADSTGYMAAGHRQTDWPRKCFNGQKNWQLGWYYSRQETVRMPELDKGSLIKLAAFVDYDLTDHDEPVLLNIADSYFLQYNRAKGFNVDTEEKKNQATITAPTGRGSDSIEGLDVGDVFTDFFFDKSKRTLIVEACEKRRGEMGADIIIISVAFGRSLCGRDENTQELQAKLHFAAPTKQPVSKPTMEYVGLPLSMLFSTGVARVRDDPTLSPEIQSPTQAPSRPPSFPPTENPTDRPTAFPSHQPTKEHWSNALVSESSKPRDSRLWQLIYLMKSIHSTASSSPSRAPSYPTHPKDNENDVPSIFHGRIAGTGANPLKDFIFQGPDTGAALNANTAVKPLQDYIFQGPDSGSVAKQRAFASPSLTDNEKEDSSVHGLDASATTNLEDSDAVAKPHAPMTGEPAVVASMFNDGSS